MICGVSYMVHGRGPKTTQNSRPLYKDTQEVDPQFMETATSADLLCLPYGLRAGHYPEQGRLQHRRDGPGLIDF